VLQSVILFVGGGFGESSTGNKWIEPSLLCCKSKLTKEMASETKGHVKGVVASLTSASEMAAQT
jgi:hypothetical protein